MRKFTFEVNLTKAGSLLDMTLRCWERDQEFPARSAGRYDRVQSPVGEEHKKHKGLRCALSSTETAAYA